MPKFKGFSAGKPNTIAIHAQFFSEVVPMIDDLAELKICLFSYFALMQKEGQYRYLIQDDFAQNTDLMRGLEELGDNPALVLDDALDKAVKDGFLLVGDITLDTQQTKRLYFMNTARGRLAIQQLSAGHWQPDDNDSIEILPERPSIFGLYEENIGALTPMIAEHLKEAEDDYPYHWIVDAIKLAIENNVRRWKYISAILARWKQEGRIDVNEATERSHQRTNQFAGLNWSDFTDD
ncbi:MAG: DnaD domain protein [Phototrophicaceae bacterium]